MPPAHRLPSFADLPRFWTAADAQRVFTALDASGLSVGAFARATGLSPTRLGPAYRSRMAARLGVTLGVEPVRLVELVARAAPSASARVPGPTIRTTTPNGWHLEIPGELLTELVRALGARPC